MSELKPGLCSRFTEIKNKLKEAEKSVDRKEGSVELLPVSKTFGIEAIIEGVKCGMTSFGENYVQEGCSKIDLCRNLFPNNSLTWHLIGPLQSNKTRLVAERFDWVQTIDRVKIAQRLSDQRPAEMRPLNVLIEVNISNQESKSGVAPEQVRALADELLKMPNLKLRGLMCIPEPGETPEEKLIPLRAMKTLFDRLKDEGYEFDTLSMGMSGDMAEAVQAGSTMVRVGTAIFGPRQYTTQG